MNTVSVVRDKQIVDELARKHHWGTRDLEKGDMPTRSYFQDGWWIEPLTDESTLTPLAVKRKQMVEETGVDVEWIMMYETTNLLGARVIKRDWRKIIIYLVVLYAVGIAAYFLANALVSGAITTLGLAATPVAVATVDPLLVCRFPDGSRKVLCQWEH